MTNDGPFRNQLEWLLRDTAGASVLLAPASANSGASRQ